MPDGGRAPVVRGVLISAPREEVWRALTCELLSTWLGEVVELEPRAGGSVVVQDAHGSIRRGLVETVEPARSLVFRWRNLGGGPALEVGEATRVAFALEDEGRGTRVTVTEEPATMVAVVRGS